MRKKYKIVSIILLLLMSFSLVSCKENNTIASSKGEMLKLTIDKIQENDRDGIFIMNKDDTFTPVMNGASDYAGPTDKSNPTRYIWFSDMNIDYSKLIPVVNSKTKLVGIYSKSENMPTVYTLEKYDFKGYTIGCHFEASPDTKEMYLITEDALDDSFIYSQLLKSSTDDVIEIAKINGSDKLPTSNIDRNMRMLLGLEKDKDYKFNFYTGTKYMTMTTKADTAVFQSKDITILQTPLKKTSNGYFEILLPDNLDTGYYYICDAGLFKYEKN